MVSHLLKALLPFPLYFFLYMAVLFDFRVKYLIVINDNIIIYDNELQYQSNYVRNMVIPC